MTTLLRRGGCSASYIYGHGLDAFSLAGVERGWPGGVIRGSESERLLGRDGECAAIGQALDVADRGEAVRVWIEGEPGSGKTALAEWTRSRADRFRCVSVGCVEGESGLSLAAVLTVVRSLRHLVGEVAPRYRAPLQGLLGLECGGTNDPFLLGAAVLDLISTAAVKRPLLIMVDDWHWIDAASEAALEFAFRRLENDAVAVLVMSRCPPVGPLTRPSDVVIQLTGLGTHAGIELLARAGSIAPDVAGRIVAATAGLPLALQEVGSRLSADQRIGAAPLPSPLPVGDRLLAEYGARLSRLSGDVRAATGVVAAAGSDPTVVSPALSFLGLDHGLLDVAEAAGVVSLDHQGPVFRHPLMRAAALTQLSGSVRRRIEWALASVVEDPERRAIHLVASTQGPSLEISAFLEEAAEEVGRRRGPLAAAGIWAEAARVTPAGPVRIARLFRAGESLTAVGRVPEAGRCLAELLGSTDDPVKRAEAVVLMLSGQWWSEPAEAARDALAEAERVVNVSLRHAARLYSVAALCQIIRADFRSALRAIPSEDLPVEDDAPPTLEIVARPDVLATVGRVAEANLHLSSERVRHWTQMARRGPADPAMITGLQVTAIALTVAGRFNEAQELVDVTSSTARRCGRPQGIAFLLWVDSLLAWWRGDWDRMNAVLIEMLTLAGDTGEPALADAAEAFLGRLAAARGDAELVHLYLGDPPGSISRPRSLATVNRMSALGLWYLGMDRLTEAATVLRELDELCAKSDINNDLCSSHVGDYVDALVRLGDHEQATAVVDRTLERAKSTGLAWPQAMGLRGQGLLASGPAADRCFASALQAWPDGFDGARTRLAWAENLLARQEARHSQELLNLATQEFSRLGARPWLERTSALLGTPPVAVNEAGGPPGLFSALTAQELKVALKVAEGCTNREAAAELFISAKTVEHHLSSTYNKLGIRSRTELARLAAETDSLRTTRRSWQSVP